MIRIKGLFLFFLICAIIILLCSLIMHKNDSHLSPCNIVLSYKLEGKDTVQVNEPVIVRFVLINQSDDALYFLNWYTPFEGFKGSIFSVTKNGQEIEYTGRMVKRGNPSREDYLKIEQEESLVATLDLSSVYDMSEVGEYHIKYISRIHDVILFKDVEDRKEVIPRVCEKHRGIEIAGNSLIIRIVR